MGALTPVVFLAHGSPMTTLGTGPFVQHLRELGRVLPKPKAILMISAHWQTHIPALTSATNPKTIHDFSGFPPELHAIQYPAAGSQQLVERVVELLDGTEVERDESWGFDHGTWTVLRHVFPAADVPVVQLGMDKRLRPRDHYELAVRLRPLRQDGTMIMGSGNIVHNLGTIDWDESASPHAETVEFDARVVKALRERDLDTVIDIRRDHPLDRAAHPTIEHYLPLVYCLGAVEASDPIRFSYEGYQHASLSMRSVVWGDD